MVLQKGKAETKKFCQEFLLRIQIQTCKRLPAHYYLIEREIRRLRRKIKLSDEVP
jgi:hypothetical protein